MKFWSWLKRNFRRIEVICSRKVRLDVNYVDEIAPLNSLPSGATMDQLKTAISELPHFDPEGQYFFPAEAYLAARASQPLGVEFIHRCRVQRLTPVINGRQISWLPAAPEPEELTIYDRPYTRNVSSRIAIHSERPISQRSSGGSSR